MNTEIQKYDPEVQRLQSLAEYKAHEHLVQWTAFDKKANKSVVVDYYPAGWRLYELRLRYPNANFSSDIIHMDPERNFCIVRARLYLGNSYEDSMIRAEAHKQGPLTDLDKVETKAKARAARDFGIGTEYALDMDDTPEGQVVGTIVTSEASSQDVVDAPRQLPRPAKSQSQRSAPARQAAPEQNGKIIEGQINALLNLYGKLNQVPPPDLPEWTFAQARTAIMALQSDVKQAS